MEENSYKLIVLGDTGVGKTSIISQRMYQRFDESVPLTVGVSNFNIIEKVKGIDIELKIWDTAGQEQYSSLIPMFSRNSDVCILCCDAVSPSSFEHLEAWKSKLNDSGCNPPIILAINKIDLVSDNTEAVYDQYSEILERFENIVYVSAKVNSGIDELFRLAAEKAYEVNQQSRVDNLGMKLNEKENSDNKCC